MFAIVRIDTGASRPPPLLRLAVLAIFAILARRSAWACLLLLAIGASTGRAADACRLIEHGRIGAEWLDGTQPIGARLAIRDNRWSWVPAHGGEIAFCPTCSAADVAKGVLRIGLAPFVGPDDERKLRDEIGQQSASAIEFALDPRSVATGLWVMTNFLPRGVAPVTDMTPVTLLGTSGLARAVLINSAGNIVRGVAVALQDRCLSLFGVFFREDNGPIAIDDLRQIDAALTLERYTPEFSPAQLAPRPAPLPRVEFPLGDARRQWDEERQRR